MLNQKMVAVVGLGAILPAALGVASFWKNILTNQYSVTDVPSGRWDASLYYDPAPAAVDNTNSKIGAFVRDYQFDPLKNGIAILPKVLAAMDGTQQWAVDASLQALKDYGYPSRKLDQERMAVILGIANSGERQYRSTFSILLPEYLELLQQVPDFEKLPADGRAPFRTVSRPI